MLVRLLELGGVLVAGLFLIVQVILPLLRNEKPFPFLRKPSARARIDENFRAMNQRVSDLEHARDRQAELEARLAALEAAKPAPKETTKGTGE